MAAVDVQGASWVVATAEPARHTIVVRVDCLAIAPRAELRRGPIRAWHGLGIALGKLLEAAVKGAGEVSEDHASPLRPASALSDWTERVN